MPEVQNGAPYGSMISVTVSFGLQSIFSEAAVFSPSNPSSYRIFQTFSCTTTIVFAEDPINKL